MGNMGETCSTRDGNVNCFQIFSFKNWNIYLFMHLFMYVFVGNNDALSSKDQLYSVKLNNWKDYEGKWQWDNFRKNHKILL